MDTTKEVIKIKNKYIVTLICLILILSAYSIYIKIYSINSDKFVNSKKVDNKVIYLTFDDGPTSPVTDDILDVLKEKNVKATFFVIGKKVKLKEKLIRRMYNEGHGIGLHTYTHNVKKIYSSDNAFIEEMDKTACEIHDVLGITPSAIRFPSGSIGHLDKSLYRKLKEKNYRIFDWNARITDGVKPNKSPDAFFNEAIKTGQKWSTIFMLMHCDAPNHNTCRALPAIIDYYKNNHYTFKIIDNYTQEYFFRFNKDQGVIKMDS